MGITINSYFSVSEHVSCVIGKCAQTIQALRVLRSHRLCNDALHLVHRTTAIGKLLYTVNAWWGFTSAADCKRMKALVKRGVRSGLSAADTPNLTELIESSDDALFNRVLCNQDHILFPQLLPDERDFTYNLRKRNHNRLLTIKQGRLCSCKFYHLNAVQSLLLTLMHFILFSLLFPYLHLYYCVIVAFFQHVLSKHAMLRYANDSRGRNIAIT